MADTRKYLKHLILSPPRARWARRPSVFALKHWIPVPIGHAGMTLLFGILCTSTAQADEPKKLTPNEIITILKNKVKSTGNIADAVEEATGQRGFMTHDMKPIFKTKIVGPAATALLRPVLRTDKRTYRNYALEILDEAEVGSVLISVVSG